MNKNLDRLIGQEAAEKRCKGWALTTFLREAWGLKKQPKNSVGGPKDFIL